MQTQPNVELNKKMLMFQQKVQAIKKDGLNPHFGKAYATLPGILSDIKPILNEVGLLLTQPIIDGRVFSVITDPPTGESMESSLELPQGATAQGMGSAITYFRRYTLGALLSLEIEDDDGNEATKQQPVQNAATPQTSPTPAINDDRKWLNEKALATAIERIKAGEKGVYERCNEAFKISKVNREALKKATEEAEKNG